MPYFETRFTYLSEGDIFDDVPYTLLRAPLQIAQTEGLTTASALTPLFAVRAMLVTPTCDFRRPSAKELDAAKDLRPYTLENRVRVAQIMPLEDIERSFDSIKRAQNLDLMRRFDSLRRYMYLPPLPGENAESAVALGPSWLIDLDVLVGLKRLTQLTFAAAQQLHYKTVMYATAVIVARGSFHPSMD